MNIGIYVRIFAALALVAMLGLIAHYVYEAGGDAREAPYLKRDRDAAAKTAAAIKAAEDRVRAAEALAADRLASISGAYQNGLQENHNAKDRVIADLRGGNRRLFIDTAGCPAGGNNTPQVAAGAGRRDGEARAELSQQASEWLVGLASEADAIVRQLTACQAVVEADRAMRVP